MLSNEQLENLRTDDTFLAPDESDLQMFPPVYTHRRQLLAHIADMDTKLADLQQFHDWALPQVVPGPERANTAWLLPDGSINADPDFQPHADFLTGPMRCRRVRYVVEDTAL